MSEQLHPNHQLIIDTFTADPTALIEWAADRIVGLGARAEWDMDDNFETTESLARLPGKYGLPSASDQGRDALRFYGEAAQALGYRNDLDEDEESR